jgi:dTMP kinase
VLPGWFVSVEGPDGAGKTSQVERLRRRALAAGFDVVVTREPGGTVVGERIREILLGAEGAVDARTDALLFNAARAQLVVEVIRPALARGSLVISTRFADSTLAYQGFGAGLPLEALRALERVATGGLEPQVTVLLDVDVAVGLARKPDAEMTRFETDFDAAFHRRVREGFLALAAENPARFVVIDAAYPPDEVEAATAAVVARLAGLERLAPRPGAGTDVTAEPLNRVAGRIPVATADEPTGSGGEPPGVGGRIHR